MAFIILKKGCDKRLRLGHLWVFSNEIASIQGVTADGEIVDVRDMGGRFVGRGYLNRHSLISCRILTYKDQVIDRDFFYARLNQALSRRERLFPGAHALRVVNSEGDFLPGLIVDRYEDTLSIQTLTLGMEMQKDVICGILRDILAPRIIVERNDVPVRQLEGLKEVKGVLRGSGETSVVIDENGIRLHVNLLEGQKTGLFLDQKENRFMLREYVRDKKVLDAFCYTGAWSISAAKGGAAEITGIDSSQKAVDLAVENARLNDESGRCRFIRADVFDTLKEMNRDMRRFDVVVLDPPAFVKNKKELMNAMKGYLEINSLAMGILNDGGCLVTSSCSYHVDRELFMNILVKSAAQAGKTVRLLEFRSQGRDHPSLLPMRETEYLKCAFVEINSRI